MIKRRRGFKARKSTDNVSPKVLEQRRKCRKYYAANREKVSLRHQATYNAKSKHEIWAHHLKYSYGLTVDDYRTLHAKQKGLCAICGREKALEVDHDHKTGRKRGRVRGLLCRRCNTGLGKFKDSSELLKRAAMYVS